MTELVLVEGVSDLQLISYYLQKVYGWIYKKDNFLKITTLNNYEKIENLEKNCQELILCSVGGNTKFNQFINNHNLMNIIIEENISSIMIITDRDKESIGKITKNINNLFKDICFKHNEWINNQIKDYFDQIKFIKTYLLIIPDNQKGALENVILEALNEITEEKELIETVINFIDSLKVKSIPTLVELNDINKATIGTYFSIRNLRQAMRSFSHFISKIDWSKSKSLNDLFAPFKDLGKN